MSTSTESAQLAGRASWSGKLAFVLSAAASAVGLGAMWRFPYLAAKYGGGMFLFVYLVLVFTIGISLLLLENALGRKRDRALSVPSRRSARSLRSSAFLCLPCRSSSCRTTA